MGRLDLPDKYRDEDLTEQRRRSRRRFFIGGRRSSDNRNVERPKKGNDDGSIG